MLKKIVKIFRKEIKVGLRDGIILIILIMPLIMAFGIKFLAPGITDLAIKVAILENDTQEHFDYLNKYVQVEQFSSIDELERRVKKNDDIIGYIPTDDGYKIILEGNEPEEIITYAKLLNVYYSHNATTDTSVAEIYSFQKEDSPLKAPLTNMLIMMIIMLAGMIISLAIVEEKTDNTISAINVTPVTPTEFIIGKTMLGGTSAMLGIIASLLILGYYNINWFLVILVAISSMFISFIIGFLQGLASNDVIEAAGGVKLVVIPMAGSIVGYMLLPSAWQWTMYWSPFYWSHKANDLILTNSGDWKTILLSTGIVIFITLLIYVVTMPKIRKGLT